MLLVVGGVYVAKQAALLMEWLEGEGERQRRPTPLPRRVGDPAVRGWVHVGVCVLGGVVAAGVFHCWLGLAWDRAARVGSGLPWLKKPRFAVGQPMTLEGARVELVVQGFEASGGRKPWAVIV